MARGDGKANPWVIVRAHHRTYVDVRTGRIRFRDWLVVDGLPAIVGAVSGIQVVEPSAAVAVGLLTVSGLLSALMFGLMIQVLDRAESWADAPPDPGTDTSRHADYLVELAANTGYAALVSVAAGLVFVLVGTTHGEWLRASSAIGLALALHLVLTLFMVMKRVFLLTVERTQRARTAGDPSAARLRSLEQPDSA